MLWFVWLEDRSAGTVAKLDFSDWSELHEALALLKSKTGVWLDPYSDTRIAPDHAKLLVRAIRSKPYMNRSIETLARTLDESVSSNRWLLAIGD
jgi:hypothetical protein